MKSTLIPYESIQILKTVKYCLFLTPDAVPFRSLCCNPSIETQLRRKLHILWSGDSFGAFRIEIEYTVREYSVEVNLVSHRYICLPCKGYLNPAESISKIVYSDSGYSCVDE